MELKSCRNVELWQIPTSYFDFIIIAFSIFLFIRLPFIAGIARKKKFPSALPPPAPSKEEVLLTEIRDLLKEQAGKIKYYPQKNGLPSNACRTARDLYTSRHFQTSNLFCIFSTRKQEEQSFPIQL